MSLPVLAASATASYLSGATINITPTMVTGFAAGDLLLIAVGVKPDTSTVNTPSGWTKIGEFSGGGGTTGIDTGPTKVLWFYKIAVGGDTAPTINITSTNVCWAMTMYVTEATDTFNLAAAGGTDATTGTAWSVTCSTDPGLTVDDLVLVASVVPTDVTTPSQFTAEAVSATGVSSWGTVTELIEFDTNVGNDIGGFLFSTSVVAGTSTAAPVITATASGTTTNVRGPSSLLRIRGASTTPIGNEVQLVWDSSAVVTDNLQLVWNDRALIADVVQVIWNSRTNVGDTTQLVWNVNTFVGDTAQLVWNVRAPVGDTVQLVWDTLGITLTAVGNEVVLLWNNKAVIADNLQLVWNNRVLIADVAQLLWNNRANILDNLQVVWNDRSLVTDNLQLVWGVNSLIAKPVQLVWKDNAVLADALQLVWHSRATVSDALQLLWDTLFVVGPTPVAQDLQLLWKVISYFDGWTKVLPESISDYATDIPALTDYINEVIVAGDYTPDTPVEGIWIPDVVDPLTWTGA